MICFMNWHKRKNGSDVTIRTDAPAAEIDKLIATYGLPDNMVMLDTGREQTRIYKRLGRRNECDLEPGRDIPGIDF